MNLFPPPDKNGQIKFGLGKSLPYKKRMWLVAALLVAGLGLQVALSFWAGFAALLAAALLGRVKGYDAKPKIVSGLAWERVTPDEYAKVKVRAEQLKRWDEDFFDITSTKGAVFFCAACVAGWVLYLAVSARYAFPDGSGFYIGLDAAVLLAPLWLTGVREYLRKDKLIIKIDLLKRVMDQLTVPSEAQVFPMLALANTCVGAVSKASGPQTAKTDKGGTEPEDARLLVKLVGAPAAFYGMQVQVSINTVQGTDYPYLYCVLIAKSGAGLLENYERFVPRPKSPAGGSIAERLLSGLGLRGRPLVYEAQKNSDVDILVIRQRAEKNAGYSTDPAAAGAIVASSFELAKKLVAANSSPVPAGACGGNTRVS